jgi:hypothetical protein
MAIKGGISTWVHVKKVTPSRNTWKRNVLEKQSVVVDVNTEENNQTTATQKQSVRYGAINTVTSELFLKWRWKNVEMKLIREIGKWMLEESRWEKEGFTLAKIGEKKNGRQHIWKTLASMLWRRLRRKKNKFKIQFSPIEIKARK